MSHIVKDGESELNGTQGKWWDTTNGDPWQE